MDQIDIIFNKIIDSSGEKKYIGTKNNLIDGGPVGDKPLHKHSLDVFKDYGSGIVTYF